MSDGWPDRRTKTSFSPSAKIPQLPFGEARQWHNDAETQANTCLQPSTNTVQHTRVYNVHEKKAATSKMVIVDDFKVELVEAQTKQPFQEHTKDDQTYIEVEPDVEYYISYQRIHTTLQPNLIITCSVDGKDLGWQGIYRIGLYGTDTSPRICGALNNIGDYKIEEKALIFAKPTIVKDADDAGALVGPMLMGNIELKLFEMGDVVLLSPKSSLQSEISRSEGPTIVASKNSAGIKQVRSSLGETSNVESVKHPCTCVKGPLLKTITLNYCTVPGLIHAGILPKPPNIYDYHRMISKSKNGPIPPLLVQPQRVSRELRLSQDRNGVADEVTYYDMFDLTKLDDDNEEKDASTTTTTQTDSSTVENDKNISSSAKVSDSTQQETLHSVLVECHPPRKRARKESRVEYGHDTTCTIQNLL